MAAHYIAGTYNVECRECALSTVPAEVNKVGGWPKIEMKILVKDWVNEKDEFVPEKRQFERTIEILIDPNDESSVEDVMNRLREAGWRGSQFETLCQDMVGVSFAADCVHKEDTWSKDPKYRGQIIERWFIWTPRKERKPLENNPSVAKSLNALFGKRLKEGVKKQESVTTTVKEESKAPRGDDEGPPPGAISDDDLF